MDGKMANDEWVAWNGQNGHGPVSFDTLVEVMMLDGFEHEPTPSGFWAGDCSKNSSNWWHLGQNCDIISYRVIKDANNA